MQINIPINQMNQVTGLSGTAGVSPVIQAVVDFLGDPTKRSYHVTLNLNERLLIPDAPATWQTLSLSVYDDYLLKWATVLIKSGLPADRFHIGVDTGHPGFVTLMVEPVGKIEK